MQASSSLPQKQTSQNSQIQLIKQKPLLEFCQTKEQHDLVKSISNSVAINQCNIEDLLKVVSQWRMFIGISDKDFSEEIALNTKFIFQNFNYLTIAEIQLAYNLSILGKLDNVEFYGTFSPMYISKVLNSYLYYRKMELADTVRKKEKHDQEQLEVQNKPTPEQQAELTKEIFIDFYKEWQDKGEINDVFNICYNFLRKHKIINPDKDEISFAVVWGKDKAALIKSKVYKPFDSYRLDIDKEEKRWARNWCVQNYFKKNGIDVLINNIKSELFI